MEISYQRVGWHKGFQLRFFHFWIRQQVIFKGEPTTWASVTHGAQGCRFGRICKCYMSLSKVDPPTAQTDHHKDLKFGMGSHLVPNRGAIEAIFDMLPQSRDMGQGWGYPWGAKMAKKFFSIFFIFSTWLLNLVS